MQVDLGKIPWDHPHAMMEKCSKFKASQTMTPYPNRNPAKMAVFTLGFVFSGKQAITDGPNKNATRARFPLGIHPYNSNVDMYTKGLKDSKFRLTRVMKDAEYVALYPEYLDPSLIAFYPRGKRALYYDARKFFPESHRYKMEEELTYAVVKAIYTLLPGDLQVWRPFYSEKVENYDLVALKIVVAMEFQQVDDNPLMAHVQVPLGWIKGTKRPDDDLKKGLAMVAKASPYVTLGAMHGLSLHVSLEGDIDMNIRAYFKGKSSVIMSVADTCPQVNFDLCVSGVRVVGVLACATPVNPKTAVLIGSVTDELEESFGKNDEIKTVLPKFRKKK